MWLNTCIGETNYWLFYTMVCLFALKQTLFMVMSIFYLCNLVFKDWAAYIAIGISSLGFLFITQLLLLHSILRWGVGRHVTTYMCILWWRGRITNKKTMTKEEY
jgi:hypothetical protein